MIRLQDVRKLFHQGRPNQTVALDGVSMEIRKGRITVLRGPSGSGKTTLLTIVGCMARPTSGRIFLDGRELSSLPERFLTEIRRITFGFIFQQFCLISGLSVLENVLLPTFPLGTIRSRTRKRAMELLRRMDMHHEASRNVETLSGGEAQRVAIARALMNDPSVLIADEPTAHLDTGLSREFMETMEILRKEGKTILMASHDPIVFDSPCVDRVIDMRDGRILEE